VVPMPWGTTCPPPSEQINGTGTIFFIMKFQIPVDTYANSVCNIRLQKSETH
jgi:hypothetical protein